MKGIMPDENWMPSNGSDGMDFECEFCQHCIHEKFMHTQNHDDKQCAILNEALLEDWVKEWVEVRTDNYISGKCTAHIRWDWGRDDEGNIKEPPHTPPDDPNQLVIPFMIEEVVNNVIEIEEAVLIN